jgi:hypothetical protein
MTPAGGNRSVIPLGFLDGNGKNLRAIGYGLPGYSVRLLDGILGTRYSAKEYRCFVSTGGLQMEMSAPTLVYSDEKFEVWVDAEKDNITLSMTDRGVTLLFTKEEWLEFQEVIGNIMLEEQEEGEEEEETL